jgi:tRNA uridine 5-carboxymethylaminomethyl modification enzyme
VEIYVNGFSTSLPNEIQIEALRKVPGFEKVKFFRPGYAIEYDYFPPTQLRYTLETKLVDGLFFAGQINGTTGYEEAACQGLMAGVNAHRKVKGEPEFILGRDEAYIGVLIDDLINKGTEEPYRMFTSRAEYRILLRQDNADQRLIDKGYELGLVSEERMTAYQTKMEKVRGLHKWLLNHSVEPSAVNGILEAKGTAAIKQKIKIHNILGRPQIAFEDLLEYDEVANYVIDHKIEREVWEQVQITLKYQGYIDKEKENAKKLDRLENLNIPGDFDYSKLASLSLEAKEKLSKIKPESIKQAKRISGVSPSDINVLLVYMGR